MVINQKITISDFSRFVFATLTFWLVKSRRGPNGPVYPVKRRDFLGFTWPTCGVKGCTKKNVVTPLVSLMNPYTSKERGFLNVTGSKGPMCGVKGGK